MCNVNPIVIQINDNAGYLDNCVSFVMLIESCVVPWEIRIIVFNINKNRKISPKFFSKFQSPIKTIIQFTNAEQSQDSTTWLHKPKNWNQSSIQRFDWRREESMKHLITKVLERPKNSTDFIPFGSILWFYRIGTEWNTYFQKERPISLEIFCVLMK